MWGTVREPTIIFLGGKLGGAGDPPSPKKSGSLRPQEAHGKSFQEAGFQFSGRKRIFPHLSCREM